MKNSKIEWCDHTVNFWWGCTKVSPGCLHCYAETINKVFGRGRAGWGAGGPRWLRDRSATQELLRLDAAAAKRGQRERVFINSMSDTFEDHPALDVARTQLWFALSGCTHLDCLLLTKRPEKVCQMVPMAWLRNWPRNVWVGTTVEDQQRVYERIPALLRIPCAVRFLSCEPMLGRIDIHAGEHRGPGYRGYFDWVICGGESGPKARPMHPDWARSLRDQCKAAGVPFFFKQWGEWYTVKYAGTDARVTSVIVRGKVYRRWHDWQDGHVALALGKIATGRALDGVEHNDFPDTK